MFTKTIRTEFNFTMMPPPISKPKQTNNQLQKDGDEFQDKNTLENDMQLEDLSDCEETIQNAKNNTKHQSTLKLVQKSRDQQDQEYQLKAMKALIDRDIKDKSQQNSIDIFEQSSLHGIQEYSKQQAATSDDEDGFDNVNAILDSKETKSYELINSNIFSSLQQSNAILIDQQDQDSEKFRGFMSWASDEKQKPSISSDSQINNPQQSINDHLMQKKYNESDALNRFDDPFMLLLPVENNKSQMLLEQLKLEEQMFKYNEHGIYSDHSEDEESTGLQGAQNGLKLSIF